MARPRRPREDDRLAVVSTHIASPISYLDSGPPHGHAYTTVAADATNFPDDPGLPPSVFMKAGTGASTPVWLDWTKCVQIR